ncbi:MAG: hypothetical protein LUM44_10195 [Pyrinomonadaceae bacterium]|nr:hypothetical protein [Pyrinomonadaceae bacterium]
MKYLIFSILFLISTLSAFAQTRTVTNADLEKYRQARVKAEREYRENYKRLGMPSPEELERREAERKRETAELSARLRAEQYERAQIDAARQQYEAVQRQNFYNNRLNNQPYYAPGYGYGFQSYGFPDLNVTNRFFRRSYPQYDNGTRLWSFTNIQTNPRFNRPNVVIRPMPRR